MLKKIIFTLSFSLCTAIALNFSVAGFNSEAFAQYSSLPRNADEKAIYDAWKQSVEADKLFKEKRYEEARKIYESCIVTLDKTFKFNSNSQYYNFPIDKKNTLTANVFRDNLEKILQHTGEILGLGNVREQDILYNAYYAERLVEQRYYREGRWREALEDLDLSIAKVESLVERKPSIRNQTIASRGVQLNPSAILKSLASRRAEVMEGYNRDQVRMPLNVETTMGFTSAELDKLLEAVKKGELLDRQDAGKLENPEKWLKLTASQMENYYAAEGKQMPDDLLKPLKRNSQPSEPK
jgi:hypothetical protein